MKKIYILIASAVILFSCNNEDQLGADFEEVGEFPEPIGEFTFSKDSVDFTKGENIFFEQEFEKSTRWVLTLTGISSGATKTFEFISTSIDESNSLWDGRPDAAPFFQVEDVQARITFPSYPVFAVTDTFTISGIKNEEIQTTLFADFTTIRPFEQVTPNDPSAGFWSKDFPLVTNTNTSFDSYDGAYLYLEGQSQTASNPYVNIIKIPTVESGVVTDSVIPLSPDPTRVYLNAAVYGTNTQAILEIVMTSKQSGVTGKWTLQPDWEGWRYVSIKMSDLVLEGGSNFDPSQISITNLVLLSDADLTATPRVVAKIAIDQMVYSLDSPLGSVNN